MYPHPIRDLPELDPFHHHQMNCLKTLLLSFILTLPLTPELSAKESGVNFLLITVDDMSCDSTGVFGCPLPGITPNIDRLAAEGLRFEHGHVTVAICQPCRAVWMTGRYPHNSGALGFDRINPGVPTLPEALKEAGYHTGLMAKHGHVIPSRAAAFNEIVPAKELRNGRSPELFGKRAAAFFAAAKKAGKPFFLMANSQDPHRPFVGSKQESNAKKRDKKNKSHQYGGGFPETKIAFDPAKVPLPGFLPDLPDIRQELSEYFTSVKRADAITGAVLKALDDAGMRDNTLVMFLSDHGMPLPYAKTNCWHHSTRTPWIVRWPGTITEGAHDKEHVIGGVDLAPTVLDALGLPALEGEDGRSFLPLLKGEKQDGRDIAFAHINTIASKRAYTMRAAITRDFRYIWNGWHDGKTGFRNESLSGLTWKAMTSAAKTNTGIAARVEFYSKRVPEELYQTARDPDALQNLITEPAQKERIANLKEQLRRHMHNSKDPQLIKFTR
jgi:N-sulfoglucosamine sulfohydrolase